MNDPEQPASSQAVSTPATPSPAAPVDSTVVDSNKPPRADASWGDDEGDDWRHAPVAPKDENVLDSFGRSVSEAVTGSAPASTRDKDKTSGRS